MMRYSDSSPVDSRHPAFAKGVVHAYVNQAHVARINGVEIAEFHRIRDVPISLRRFPPKCVLRCLSASSLSLTCPPATGP